MRIVIRAKVMFHDRVGRLVRDQVVSVPDQVSEKQATEWLRRGFAERFETKQLRDRPSVAAGAVSSASPAVQVSQRTMSNSSGAGAKRQRLKTLAA
jgi:hypothetical protein